MKRKDLELSKKLIKNLQKRTSDKSNSKDNSSNSGANSGKDNRGKDEFKNGIRIYKGARAWRSVPPKEGEPETKEVGSKTYNWCSKHKAWVDHDPSKCTFCPKKVVEKWEKKSKDKKDKKRKFQAKQACVDDDESDDYIKKVLRSIAAESDDNK